MVAVQIIIAVIPIVGIVMGSVLVFFYFLWRHKQIMLQIKTNTYIQPAVNIRLFCLLLGIMLTVIGSVLFGLSYCRCRLYSTWRAYPAGAWYQPYSFLYYYAPQLE